MLPPTVKQFFFKLLISIFVHDYKNVLRQYRQAYTTQRQMEQYLRVITPEDLYDKELVRISERMSDLQKLIYQLRKKGLSDEAISRKLNLPLHKIQKHLDLVELDILYRAQNEMYMSGDRKKREKICRSKGCACQRH